MEFEEKEKPDVIMDDGMDEYNSKMSGSKRKQRKTLKEKKSSKVVKRHKHKSKVRATRKKKVVKRSMGRKQYKKRRLNYGTITDGIARREAMSTELAKAGLPGSAGSLTQFGRSMATASAAQRANRRAIGYYGAGDYSFGRNMSRYGGAALGAIGDKKGNVTPNPGFNSNVVI